MAEKARSVRLVHRCGSLNIYAFVCSQVMTFVTEREIERQDGVVRITKNPAGLLKTFYRRLRINPVWYDLSAVNFDS